MILKKTIFNNKCQATTKPDNSILKRKRLMSRKHGQLDLRLSIRKVLRFDTNFLTTQILVHRKFGALLFGSRFTTEPQNTLLTLLLYGESV